MMRYVILLFVVCFISLLVLSLQPEKAPGFGFLFWVGLDSGFSLFLSP